jgi:prolyl-tRNA synthetase
VSTRLVGGLVMSHSDDDGLVLPPRLAPVHVVILPIYRNEEERTTVTDYCRRVERELSAQTYDGAPVRVSIDSRDLRGGEKTWHHIKRGVPVRLEIGPRDVQSDAVFAARRDRPPKEKSGVPRAEFVANIGKLLGEIQQNLFDRAEAAREAASRKIDNADEFEAFFTPKNAENPEIHGGLAWCHFSEGPELAELLARLKVTIRCVPIEGPTEPGKCFLTGRPSPRRGLFAKAY